MQRTIETIRYEDENGESQSVRPGNWGEYQLVMKNAYFQGYIHRAFNVRAGMIPIPWIVEEEAGWKYRFVEEPLSSRFGSGWNEADIGVEVHGKFPGQYGEYRAGAANGEGYLRPEDNEYKAGFALIRVAPFAAFESMRGLSIAAAGRYEIADNPPGDAFDALFSPGAILRFEIPDAMVLGLEGLYRARWFQDDAGPSEGVAGSAYASVRLVNRLWGFARYDLYDYNIAQSSGTTSRADSRLSDDALNSNEDIEQLALFGLAYEFAKKFRLAISYRARFWQEEYGSGPEKGALIAPQHIAKASLEFGF